MAPGFLRKLVDKAKAIGGKILSGAKKAIDWVGKHGDTIKKVAGGFANVVAPQYSDAINTAIDRGVNISNRLQPILKR